MKDFLIRSAMVAVAAWIVYRSLWPKCEEGSENE